MFKIVNYFIEIFCIKIKFISNKSNEDNAFVISFIKKIKNFMYLIKWNQNYFKIDLAILLQTKMRAFVLFRGKYYYQFVTI